MLISLAIIAIVVAVAAPNISDSNVRKGFRVAYYELVDNLKEARIEALTRNTTVRVLFDGDPGGYTMTAFFSDLPTTTCDATGVWTQLFSRTLNLTSRFQVTGTGVGNVCFYRDNTASGGTYSMTQVDEGDEYGSATITVTIATGYLDATMD